MGEGEVFVAVLSNGEFENERNSRSELKRDLHCVLTDSQVDSPYKKQAKETLNDDVCSEVMDTASINMNANNGSTCKAVDLDSNGGNQDNSCQITSTCAEMSGDENNSGLSTTDVILEIPKKSCTTGIRKITFKFSKSKRVNTDSLPTQQPLSRWIHTDELPFESKEDKMLKKVLPSTCPTNVEKLSSTGIFEGARVQYVDTSPDKEIPGSIGGCGYTCGFSTLDYKNVLSAHGFGKHAGGAKSRHPRYRTHLENERPIYNIIEELKTPPSSLLENIVKDISAGAQHCDGVAHVDIKYQRTKSSAAKLPVPQKKGGEAGTRKRGNDLHRLLFMPNGLPDGADLAYYAKGQKVLHGTKRGNGILCDHCNRKISPSQFEAHAGCAARRQPYRHIYTSNGLALHDIAISLANGQSLTTGHSDDMCTICGNGGQLTLCSRCPRAYHAACLGSQCIVEDEWCCPDCIGKASSGDDSNSYIKPIMIRLTRVVKEVECENGGCVICRSHDFSSEIFDDQTVIICDQCEKEYHVSCLRDNRICDLKALPDGDWFCCCDCSKIHDALREKSVKGMETVPTSLLNKTFLLKGLNCASQNEVQWQIINGSKRSSEHLPLLSKATAIFREQFNPIVSSSGRDLIPVMVYGRNISGQEFGGMYTVLLLVKSVVVSAGLLRIFGREVAELPLVATSKGNQGKGYFQTLFCCIEKLLSSLNVENLVLPSSDEAKAIWTHKFGFKTMTQDRVSRYRKSYQLTAFSGTSWLEKAVRH